MDEGEKAIIKAIAWEVGDALMEKFEEKLQTKIKLHSLACETTKTVNKWSGQAKTLIIGIAIGAALVGSGGTVGIMKLLKVF